LNKKRACGNFPQPLKKKDREPEVALQSFERFYVIGLFIYDLVGALLLVSCPPPKPVKF
jgi:hypothetical protein